MGIETNQGFVDFRRKKGGVFFVSRSTGNLSTDITKLIGFLRKKRSDGGKERKPNRFLKWFSNNMRR